MNTMNTNTMMSMNSLLLDSRTDGDPSLAAKIHDCTRELMEATNAIETQAKASVDKVKAVVDVNACKVEAAKRNIYDQRKKQLDTALASANEEEKLLEVRERPRTLSTAHVYAHVHSHEHEHVRLLTCVRAHILIHNYTYSYTHSYRTINDALAMLIPRLASMS